MEIYKKKLTHVSVDAKSQDQQLVSRTSGKSWCFRLSLKAGKANWCPSSRQSREKRFPLSRSFCSNSGLQWITWGRLTWGRQSALLRLIHKMNHHIAPKSPGLLSAPSLSPLPRDFSQAGGLVYLWTDCSKTICSLLSSHLRSISKLGGHISQPLMVVL